MASGAIEPFLKGSTSENTRGLLRVVILLLIAAAAVSSRLFSVISMDVSQISSIYYVLQTNIERNG